ncbi:hypothetical protein EP56_05810 [Listeriaceae bacterium FSL A5-0209]|nr:hypothetical protein EP56_05810 [Listeriaceae bacterium FSL A5-0209]
MIDRLINSALTSDAIFLALFLLLLYFFIKEYRGHSKMIEKQSDVLQKQRRRLDEQGLLIAEQSDVIKEQQRLLSQQQAQFQEIITLLTELKESFSKL